MRDRERLYRDRTCIAALEEFLERAARDGRALSPSPHRRSCAPTAGSFGVSHDWRLRARRRPPDAIMVTNWFSFVVSKTSPASPA